MAPSLLVIETVVISTARLALFYFCRTYLLRSLYHDLRVLSSQSLSTTSSSSNLDTPSGYQTPSSPTSMLMTPIGHSTELSDMEGSDAGLPSPAATPRRKPSALIWQAKSTNDALIALSASTSQLHSEKNIQLSLARTAFAVCFSESCILFIMVMAQVADLFTPRTRKLNWDISLSVLICLILLVVPLLQCTFLTYRGSNPGSLQTVNLSRRALVVAIPYTLYLFGVFRIPVPEALASADFITKSLSRLTVLGVLILGLISGYGCVSTAAMFFADMARSDWVEPSKQDIIQAEQSLFRVRSDLLERQQDIRKRADALDAASNGPGESSGWFGKLTSAWRTGDAEMTSLQREIKGLEMLEQEMAKDAKELVQRKARIKFSRTFRGKVWKWVGWTFGVYCVFRVLSSLIHLLMHQRPSDSSNGDSTTSTRTPDLITLGLIYILSFIPLPPSLSFLHLTSREQIAAMSRQISLVLVGCIVLVSVRGVLGGVGRALRMVSGTGTGAGAPSRGSRRALIANIMLLVLAQVMGLYFLSTLIQLRNSFPPGMDEDRSEGKPAGDASLFSTLPSYEVFNSLFDWAFLISAGFTAGGRWLRRKIGL